MPGDEGANVKPVTAGSLLALGTVFRPVERRGGEFVVPLADAYFALPPERRAELLRLLVEHVSARDGACQELVLYDARKGGRVGTFSRKAGLRTV